MDAEDLRLAVYRAFAETGRAPGAGELAGQFGVEIPLFCSAGCVDAWLADTGHPCGYVMDLGTLWRLAEHWYDWRLDRGYVRREPSQAAAYLRGVGLAGPFWGLCRPGDTLPMFRAMDAVLAREVG